METLVVKDAEMVHEIRVRDQALTFLLFFLIFSGSILTDIGWRNAKIGLR
jgi:hypothetical protein